MRTLKEEVKAFQNAINALSGAKTKLKSYSQSIQADEVKLHITNLQKAFRGIPSTWRTNIPMYQKVDRTGVDLNSEININCIRRWQ